MKYAVMFFSLRSPGHDDEYSADTEAMLKKVAEQPGYLNINSVRDAKGFGITVSYWSDPEAVAAWRANTDHRSVQARGKATYYDVYAVRRARVTKKTNYSATDKPTVGSDADTKKALLKHYSPLTDGTPYSALIITANSSSVSTLREHLASTLSESGSVGIEYVTDKLSDKSIALIYWADISDASTWRESNNALFEGIDCTVEECVIERTHSFPEMRPHL